MSLSARREARRHGVRYRYLCMRSSGAKRTELARWINEGQIKPVVDRLFQFEDIKQAFSHLEAGRAKGKVVVRMQEP